MTGLSLEDQIRKIATDCARTEYNAYMNTRFINNEIVPFLEKNVLTDEQIDVLQRALIGNMERTAKAGKFPNNYENRA